MMRAPWLTGLAITSWLGVARAAPGLERDTLPVPPAPTASAVAGVELPAVPRFELPALEHGRHGVRELRVRGRGLLGTRLTVAGYITWIYDCALELAGPDLSIKEAQRQIDDNPALCERPSFYLGASPRVAPDSTLWVVDVPRAANKREQLALNRAQLALRPAVPRITTGELVAVTGQFALQSPHGEQSSDGLVVYESLEHLRPGPPARVIAAAPDPALEIASAPTPAMRAVVPVRDRNDSIEQYERCNQLLDDHQLDAAIAACRQALARWPGNHLAWYALGNAFASRDHWRAAREAYDRAAQLRPDAAMYQLYDGIALYQLAVRQAHDDVARAQRGVPDDATTELRWATQDTSLRGHALRPYRLAAALALAASSTPALVDAARRALATAAARAPQLWLASYYLGRLERDQDRTRRAAEAFSAAIRADPTQADPYVALIEVYRAWDLSDHSLAVARLASTHVTTGPVASLWYELGMAYEAKQDDAQALAAFTKVLSARDGNVRAKLQRGQIYLRMGELSNARRDLQTFLAAPDPTLGQAKQVARGLLDTVERKLRGADPQPHVGGQLTK